MRIIAAAGTCILINGQRKNIKIKYFTVNISKQNWEFIVQVF